MFNVLALRRQTPLSSSFNDLISEVGGEILPVQGIAAASGAAFHTLDMFELCVEIILHWMDILAVDTY